MITPEQLHQRWKKKQWDPVLVFYGQESYLMHHYYQELKKQTVSQENQAWDLPVFDLQEESLQSLLQELETPSFLGGRRFIVGRNAWFLTGKRPKGVEEPDLERLIRYLHNPIPLHHLLLIVEEEKLDRRKKVVKQLEKKAQLVTFTPLKGRALLKWAHQQVQSKGLQMKTETLIQLIERVKGDLRVLDLELEKLRLYAEDQQLVTFTMIQQLVPRTLEQNVFLLIEKIAERDLKQAFQIWYDLLDQKEEPIRVLALMTRQFRLLLQTKWMSQKGLTTKQLASQLRMHPYPVKLALQQQKGFTEQELRSLLAYSITCEQDIKSGRIDKELAVERIMLSVYEIPGEKVR